MPGVPGDGLAPEAARRPLRELMDDALLDGAGYGSVEVPQSSETNVSAKVSP